METIIINGEKTAYIDTKTDSQNTVVMLHSFPVSCKFLKNQIDSLSDRYRVIAPDLPGFGASDDPSSYGIPAYKNWLQSFISGLKINKESLILYGISFGGMIIANLDDIPSYKKVIFESTPLSRDHIVTHEFRYAKLLKFIPSRLVSNFKSTDLGSRLIFNTYDFLRPESDVFINDEQLPYVLDLIRSIRMKTFFQVMDTIDKLEDVDPKRLTGSNVTFIYDHKEPGLSTERMLAYLPKSANVKVCKYGSHAPSYFKSQEVMTMVGLI